MSKPLPAEQRNLSRGEFAALKRKYDDLLDSGGYVDAEYQRRDGADPQWLKTSPDLQHRDMESQLEWQSQMVEYAAQARFETPMHREVYESVARGEAYRDIAKRVGTSIWTISQIKQAYEKKREAWWARTAPEREKASKKRGRPPTLTGREQRKKTIVIRISEAELCVMKAFARTMRMSPSSAIREYLLAVSRAVHSQ